MIRTTLALLSLALLGLALAHAEDYDPVKVQVTAAGPARPDGTQIYNVVLDIEKHWHIYANPVDNDEYGQAATTILVKSNRKVQAGVRYPAGIKHKEESEKQVIYLNVYQGRVAIPLQIRRIPGDSEPLEISVQFNACKEPVGAKKGFCLNTRTVNATVK